MLSLILKENSFQFNGKKNSAKPNHALFEKWHLIQNQPSLQQILKEPPLISFKRGKSLKSETLKRSMTTIR